MELCDVTVAHGGRLGMAIRKTKVTVPEIAVLRQIHGQDAVTQIVRVGSSKRKREVELDRLRHLYQPRLQDGAHPVDELWPGQQQQNLPTYLKEIGITEDSAFLSSPPKSVPAEDAVNYFNMDGDEIDGDEEVAGATPPPPAPAKAAATAKAG